VPVAPFCVSVAQEPKIYPGGDIRMGELQLDALNPPVRELVLVALAQEAVATAFRLRQENERLREELRRCIEQKARRVAAVEYAD